MRHNILMLLALMGIFAPTAAFCPPKSRAGAGCSNKEMAATKLDDFLKGILVSIDTCIEKGGKYPVLVTAEGNEEQCEIVTLMEHILIQVKLREVTALKDANLSSFTPNERPFIIGFLIGAKIKPFDGISTETNGSKRAINAAETLYKKFMLNPSIYAQKLMAFAAGVMEAQAYCMMAQKNSYLLEYSAQLPQPHARLPLISIKPTEGSLHETLSINLVPLAETKIEEIEHQRNTAQSTGIIPDVSYESNVQRINEYIGMHKAATRRTPLSTKRLTIDEFVGGVVLDGVPIDAPTDDGTDTWVDASNFFGLDSGDMLSGDDAMLAALSEPLPKDFDFNLDPTVFFKTQETELESFFAGICAKNTATEGRMGLTECEIFLQGFIAGIENAKSPEEIQRNDRFETAKNLYTIIRECDTAHKAAPTNFNPHALDGFIEGHITAEHFPQINVAWREINEGVKTAYAKGLTKKTAMKQAVASYQTAFELITGAKAITAPDALQALSNTICQNVASAAGFVFAQKPLRDPATNTVLRLPLQETFTYMTQRFEETVKKAEARAEVLEEIVEATKDPRRCSNARAKTARGAAQAELEKRRKAAAEYAELQKELAAMPSAAPTKPTVNPEAIAAKLLLEEADRKDRENKKLERQKEKADAAKKAKEDARKAREEESKKAQNQAKSEPAKKETKAAPSTEATAQPAKVAAPPVLTKKQLQAQQKAEKEAKDREERRSAKIAEKTRKKAEKKATAEEAARRQTQQRLAGDDLRSQAERIAATAEHNLRIAEEQNHVRLKVTQDVEKLRAKELERANEQKQQSADNKVKFDLAQAAKQKALEEAARLEEERNAAVDLQRIFRGHRAKIAAAALRAQKKAARLESIKTVAQNASRKAVESGTRIAAERIANAQAAKAKEAPKQSVLASESDDRSSTGSEGASSASTASTPPDAVGPKILPPEEFIKQSYGKGVAEGKAFFQSPADGKARENWILATRNAFAKLSSTPGAPADAIAYNKGLLNGYAHQYGFTEGSRYSASNPDPAFADKWVADTKLRLGQIHPADEQGIHYHKGLIAGYSATEAKKYE